VFTDGISFFYLTHIIRIGIIMTEQVVKATRFEKFKTHLQENKVVYIASTCGAFVGAVGVAGAALAVMYTHPNEGTQAIQRITQIGWRHEANATIIQLVERSTPSKPVHLVGTKMYFDSIGDAARETGHSATMISRNVSGKIKDVKGDVFELLELAK
jgi:hypothetical protein